MSSINTNAGAMTALQTLKATNKNLETTQGRISTGARVNEAAHNAAYWSIATTMRSDNNAMSTVKDALGLGAAQVDIAYTAMDAVKDTLDQMKSKLVAASQPDIDKAKIQEEINQLQNDLKTYAKSATFSGGNWLDVESASEQKVVASFIRDADNNVSLETITVDTSKTALFTQGETGLLEDKIEVFEEVSLTNTTITEGAVATGAGPNTLTAVTFESVTWKADDSVSFSVAVGTATTEITGTYDGSAWTFTGEPTGITAALSATGLTLTITNSGQTDPAGADGDVVKVGDFSAGRSGGEVSVNDLSITNLTRDSLQDLISHVDKALSKVTTAASDLGAIKTRIGSQSDFVGKIMDAVDRGVGQLVDADMEQESSRLQALQVQQQLGIQALSIANSNTQNILSLFR